MDVTRHARPIAAPLLAGLLVLGGCAGDGGADPADAPAASVDDGGGDADEPDGGTDAGEDDGAGGEEEAVATGEDDGGDDGDQAASADDAEGAASLEDLVPPGLVGQSDLGSSTLYRSDAPFEDLVAHYESVVGEANFVNPDEVAAVWVGEVGSVSISVNLSPGEGDTVDVLVAERG